MYQIFISYRRNGGEFLGKLLHDRLNERGYDVFYDVEGLNPGKFNTQLLDVIEHCNDVLLILSPGAMDRCTDPEDWVRKEILCALEHDKNIVPIMMRGFEWPEYLPKELQELPSYEAVTANNEYFDALLDRLCRKFLKSLPKQRKENKANTQNEALAWEKYPVTAKTAITDTVQKLVDYTIRKRIDSFKFYMLCHIYLGDVKKQVQNRSLWEETLRNGQAAGRDDAEWQTYFRACGEWFLQLSDEQLSELMNFFRVFLTLYKQISENHYHGFGYATTYFDALMLPAVYYEGKNYTVRDVIEGIKPDERYLYCFYRGENLLPEIRWFCLTRSGEIKAFEECITQELAYAIKMIYMMNTRLLSAMPRFITNRAPEVITQLFSSDATFKRSWDAIQLFEPTIYGESTEPIRTLFKTKNLKVRWSFSWDEVSIHTDGDRSLLTKVNNPLENHQILDIVEIDMNQISRPKRYQYLILAVPENTDDNSMQFLENEYKVYLISLSKLEPDLKIEQIDRSSSVLTSGYVDERFALELEMYHLMGCM